MRRGQPLRRALKLLSGAITLALTLAGPREAHAIRTQAVALSDARRFGLEEFSRPRRRAPSARSRGAFAPFNQSHGGGWRIRYDERTGLPAALVAGVSAPRPGRPEAAAAAFLAEQRDLLGIDPATLSLERVATAAGHRHVLFGQTYRGLPVEFARVKVHLDERGAVTGVHSRFEPELALDITPKISESQAAAAVRQDAGVSPSSHGSLVVFPDENSGQARLAWKFTARSKLALWRYYIDARSGGVLFRYNDLRMACAGLHGTISGLVYDIDPNTTPGPVVRAFAHQSVFVGGGANVTTTDANGYYCLPPANGNSSMFTQLQGPYVTVSNFRGPSAHYDNGIGSVWSTVATAASSPHPYPSDSVLFSTVSIPLNINGQIPVKVLPIFKNFNVGGVVSAAQSGEGGNITDDSEVTVLDSAGNPVGGFLGNLGSFNGVAVPVASPVNTYRLRLRSSANPGGYGYDVSLSSYLVLGPAPAWPDPSYNLTWWPSSYTWRPPFAANGMHSEISLFYQLNQQHDFFTAGVDSANQADLLTRPVNVLSQMAPDIGDPFYDPDNDNLNFGDVSDLSPSDALADDATVPRHEYTHYVVQKIWNIQNFNQAGAISEGNADYFSATALNDSSIGLYYNGATGGGVGALRELDWQKQGAAACSQTSLCAVLCPVQGAANCNQPWQGEIHADSIFFSQSLWDVRRSLLAADAVHGQACADGLAFQSLLFFPESFQEYVEAMQQVASRGAVTACAQGGLASLNFGALIANAFGTHGLPLGAGANETHTGFESALDVSTMPAVTGTIYPAGHTDFYTFSAGPGPLSVTLTRPAHGQPPDGYYEGYGLTLYDTYHNAVATAPASFVYCDVGDCYDPAATVVLRYNNPAGGQFFLQVAGGFDSGVNSLRPYALSFRYDHPGALAGGLVSAALDHDLIGFSVAVATWARTQDYSFAYAQLRDQSQNVIPNTRTDLPGGFLAWVSSQSALGTITGQLQLATATYSGAARGFASRFPSVGTVYVEVFAYNVTGSTVSLGMSNPINLTGGTGDAALTAYNNIFNPAQGQKATIKYEVQSPGHVTLKLYSMNGTLVGTLLDGDVPAGKGSVDWAGSNSAGNRVASGIYLVHMTASGVSKTQKIVVVK